MASETSPVCRLCRRETVKLYLKGDKCYSRKCPVEKRTYPPGQHGQTRSGRPAKLSDYGLQLREKQKMRRIYGVREGKFRLYVKEAVRRTGVTGDNLMALCETRLDNVVYRLGIAGSRAQARQYVSHGHVQVNGKRVNIASYQVRPNEVIQIKEDARKIAPIVAAVEAAGGRGVPTWLKFEPNEMRGTVVSMPSRDEIDTDVQESLIVEFYSR